MILLLVAIGLCFILLVNGQKLHEHMTQKEIESVFSVNHKDIHQMKYEVVPIFHRTSELLQKGTPRIHFGAFNENYDLYLENNHVLLGSKTPIYSARRSDLRDDYIIYQREAYPVFQDLQLFHNIKERVAIAIHTNDDNNVDIYGLVGDDVAIRPLPPRIHKEVLSFNRKIVKQYTPPMNFTLHGLNNNNGSKIPFETRHHVIIKLIHSNSLSRNYSDHTANSIVKIAQEKINVKKHKLNDDDSKQWFASQPNIYRSFTRKESSNRKTLYPEILIVVDYETYKFYKKDMKNVAHYMAAFWNAVDLRFRELDDPEIRLNIAGLVIPTEPGVTSYMETYVYKNNSLLAVKTLDAIGEYFVKEKYFSKDSYDIVVGVTYRDLVRVTEGSLIKDKISFLHGIAYLEGVCYIEEGFSVSLIKDTGGFTGITTAAHELGHLMGAPHDGEETKNVTGGPCNYADGYLMGYNGTSSHTLQWSHCSKIAMRDLLNSPFIECLDNIPNVGTAYPKHLPGRLMSRDEQCKRTFNLTAFKDHSKLSDSCYVLYCKEYINGTLYADSYGTPPAEGTSCGDKKICIDGHCVDDPEL